MNRKQKIALWTGAVNLGVLSLFPPVDSFSSTDAKELVFAGFNFVFMLDRNEVINGNVLFLEIVVLLVNVAVAWLLLGDAKKGAGAKRRISSQNAILLTAAVNLMVILLFPPFEYYYAVSNTPLPSFEGFYFIFMAGPKLAIVTPLLYLEVIFVLFNCALLWFFFKREDVQDLSPQEDS
jgi:hypothetical protein